MKKNTKSAIVYARVSTAGQATEGVSLDMQEEKACHWAKANGYPVEGIFIDRGISGRKMENRPELLNALNAVCNCSGVLVVYSLSRLARSTAETILIADRLNTDGHTGKNGGKFYAVTIQKILKTPLQTPT